MNINLNEPCRWLSDSTTAENEIREIFFKHWEKLRDRFILNVNEINAWRQRLIEHTNQYADEQIRILADDFQLQRVSFDEKREENLDTTRAYCGVQNVELFTELCCACRSLEFQVAQLENINGTMVGIKVVTVSEQIERRNKEKSDASSISTNENIAEKSTFKHNDGTTDNPDEINSRNNTVTSPTLNQIDSNSSAESGNHDAQIIQNNSNNSKVQEAYDETEFNKCPICFMIFPQKMNHEDRSGHINEHCTDD